MGNRFLTFLSNLCTDLNLTDMLTCYKAMRSDIIREMPLTSSGFQIEAELTAKIGRLGCRVYEVPVGYHGREYWQGKKTSWRDGVKAVWTILKYAYVDDRENTDEGYTTLQRLRHVRRYNAWVWSLMQPHVGDRVLEVGCGVGAFTQFLRERERVVATDSNERYLRRLQASFERFDNVEVREIDWEDPDFETLKRERFDTIVCLNVLEHIANDDGALDTFAALLEPGGRLVLQVPAMHALYGAIDRAIAHFRRYEMGELTAKLRDHGFEIAEARYFNLPGMIGWWVNSVLLKRRSVPGVQARVANFLVPWLRFESRLGLRRGMALLVVARRAAGTAIATPFRMPESVAH